MRELPAAPASPLDVARRPGGLGIGLGSVVAWVVGTAAAGREVRRGRAAVGPEARCARRIGGDRRGPYPFGPIPVCRPSQSV